MAINNTVKLTGNLGSEATIIDNDGKNFAAFSIATTDSYKDKETEEWKDKETVWHDVIVFNPKIIEEVKALKKGSRVEIIGSLSYREFNIKDDDKNIKKKEAKIIVNMLELAPLVRKADNK